MELAHKTDVNSLFAYVYSIPIFFCFLIMEDIHTCRNLSNFHIVVWWSKKGLTEVARELLTFTSRSPPSLRENVLIGALQFFFL